MTLLHDSELADYRDSIRKHKLDEADFVLDEGPMRELEEGVGPLVGTVTATYKPTAVSRQYSTGHGSSWPYFFERDLQSGAFLR